MQNTRRWHFCGRPYFDLALYIQQLTVPTVMLGRTGAFTSVNLGRRLGQLNPQAIRELKESGVLPHLELPEVVIGLLQKYGLTLFPSHG